MSARGAVLLMVVAGALACRQRPAAGTCAENIDCPPGYDCKSSVCAKRPPAPGTEVPAPVPAAPAGAVPPPTAADQNPRPSESATSAADAAAPPAPPKRKVTPAPPPHAPPPPLPAPPPGRVPMWKERLKNS